MALPKTELVSEETFRRLSLGDRLSRLELHHGMLREKPRMSVEHADVMDNLLYQLYRQLNLDEYRLRPQHARLRLSSDTCYIPDVAVIPIDMIRALRDRPGSLDAYPDALPLVVEIWSPSTGGYDVNAKLADYQRRGDREIWRIHPYERIVTTWLRQPDGAYVEIVFRDGVIHPAEFPTVAIDLAALFAL
jgi:Uma2 family endonuclease